MFSHIRKFLSQENSQLKLSTISSSRVTESFIVIISYILEKNQPIFKYSNITMGIKSFSRVLFPRRGFWGITDGILYFEY